MRAASRVNDATRAMYHEQLAQELQRQMYSSKVVCSTSQLHNALEGHGRTKIRIQPQPIPLHFGLELQQQLSRVAKEHQLDVGPSPQVARVAEQCPWWNF